MKPYTEEYYQHALHCDQCLNHPDNPCAEGASLRNAYVSAGMEEIRRGASAARPDAGSNAAGGGQPAADRPAPGVASREPLPDTNRTLVLRSDFSDEKAWESICDAIRNPSGEFTADADFLSDPAYKDLSVGQLLSLQPRVSTQLLSPIPHPFLFLVDSIAITHPEHPLLAVDLSAEPGRTFRVIPSALAAVENNLSIANMDFEEFAEAVDPDGIYRG